MTDPTIMRRGRAYKLFVEETRKDLEQAANVLRGPSAPADAEIASLTLPFHKLRGAAGFLKFNEIAALAKEAEELSRSDGVRHLNRLRELLDALLRASGELPAPQDP